MKYAAMLMAGLALAACGPKAETAAPVDQLAPPAPGTPASATTTTPDTWVGRWTGPEGTFLDIAHKEGGTYELTMKYTLDDEGVYGAQAEAGVLRFTRDGNLLSIRPGTGAETGFKWLDGKQDCLIVAVNNEGYCRD